MNVLAKRAPLALGALFLALVAACWVGFIGSDDVTFARGAYGWIEHFPYVGGHGTIRYTLTVPMALSFHLLGENEFAMVLPSLAYLLAFLFLAWRTTRDAAGAGPASAALLLLVTLPLLVIQASIANVDVIELAFLFTSFALYWRCVESGADTRRLLGAGAFAGLAFLTRETAIFAAAFYAPLFLVGYRLPRERYLLIATGFLAVWSLELTYLWVMTGDPLYRFNIALHHDSTIDRTVDLAGNVIVNPLVDPLLVLLFNQEFMLLFFAAIPLGLWLCFARSIEPRRQRYARLIGWLGLSWFLCAGAVQHLLPLNPRYFTVTAAMTCILTGMALAEFAGRGKRARASAALTALALLGANSVGVLVENKDPLYGERVLARVVNANPKATLYTDPSTRYRADLLLRWEAAGQRVLGASPVPGSLFLYNPAHADHADAHLPATDLPRYRPQPGWTVVRRFELATPLPARMVRELGLDRSLPAGVWHKLSSHHPPVTLYRLPGGSGS